MLLAVSLALLACCTLTADARLVGSDQQGGPSRRSLRQTVQGDTGVRREHESVSMDDGMMKSSGMLGVPACKSDPAGKT